MMLGTRLFYTCITMEDIETCAQSVAKELGERGKHASIKAHIEPVKVNGLSKMAN
jgi:hypothetical protein